MNPAERKIDKGEGAGARPESQHGISYPRRPSLEVLQPCFVVFLSPFFRPWSPFSPQLLSLPPSLFTCISGASRLWRKSGALLCPFPRLPSFLILSRPRLLSLSVSRLLLLLLLLRFVTEVLAGHDASSRGSVTGTSVPVFPPLPEITDPFMCWICLVEAIYQK